MWLPTFIFTRSSKLIVSIVSMSWEKRNETKYGTNNITFHIIENDFYMCSIVVLLPIWFSSSFTWLQHLKSIVNGFIIVYMKTMDMNSFKRILENGKINDYLQVYRKRGLNISTFHTIGKEWKGNKSYSIDYSVNRGIHVCQSRRFWRMSSTNWKQINCH